MWIRLRFVKAKIILLHLDSKLSCKMFTRVINRDFSMGGTCPPSQLVGTHGGFGGGQRLHGGEPNIFSALPAPTNFCY